MTLNGSDPTKSDAFISLRHVAIISILSILAFSAGFEFGERRSRGNVDSAITTITSSSPGGIKREILEQAAIEGALRATGDEWANYFPKSTTALLSDRRSSVFTGIGVSLQKSRGGQIEIAGVQLNSPAFNGDLRVGDVVLEINGVNVQGASLTSVIALIKGDLGKAVTLRIQRENRQILATLKTERISLSTVTARQADISIGLIEVSAFTVGTAGEVRQALDNLNFQDGLILDLRDNPGGLIEEAVATAELFVRSGVIVSYRKNIEEVVYRVNNPLAIRVPMIVLINRATASAAEILAGAIQDRNRGVIIGEKSYGKGSVQEIIALADGSKLELTVATYATPSGRIIEGYGIEPDLAVASKELGVRALQILGGLASFQSSERLKK
jgi:carboxyl-terminal processing protease